MTQVWVHPEHVRAELGAIRWSVATDIVRPGAMGKDEIDHDDDIVNKRWAFPTREQADAFAAKLLNRNDLAFGAVIIQREVVDWFVREDGVGEWRDDGEADEVTL